MIVDFAIEHNGNILIVRQDGLIAGGEIDNLETRGAHRAWARLKRALLIRSTMSQCGGGALNAARLRPPAFVSKTNYSTQARDPLCLFQIRIPNSSKPARGGCSFWAQ